MKLRAQHSRAIVNVSSMGGQVSFAGAGAYSASKFALERMSENIGTRADAVGHQNDDQRQAHFG